MTAARGTMGYIAPEVLSRNFGTVSHKLDVFSFGMLLLEIVARRKNIDTTVENTSQWYPVNRPSMKVVVQMLEGEGDDLKIPPNPFESTHSMNQSLIVPSRHSHITPSVISESE
uniref:Protein kinase domain-containing protein n=1 Tax=Quercus lobata TaxID=97700 RepID=A0A7N2LL25_QUELO